MPRYAQPLAIAPEDLHTLRQWSRSSSVRAGLAARAKILLLAAEGLSNTQIAQQLGCSRPTVILWRRRYAHTRLARLAANPPPAPPPPPRPGSCAGAAPPSRGWTAWPTSPARAGPRPSARTARPRSWPPRSAHRPSGRGGGPGAPAHLPLRP